MSSQPKKPLVLMILDGWGIAADADDNAITRARTPNWDALRTRGQSTSLETSGEAVGLPAGQMGNSEVGHMNIGAGRIVYQDFTRISKAIEDGTFSENPALNAALDGQHRAVHIMGLLSPGGVHSHEDHLFATLDQAAQAGAKQIFVHAFLDGRDTPPRSALVSLEKLEHKLATLENAALATVTGRYYAMDRDNRWNRVEAAWQALVNARADQRAESGPAALEAAYARDENDEFVAPTCVGDLGDDASIRANDSVVFINFRADRARELTAALAVPEFDAFDRGPYEVPGSILTFTEYEAGLPVNVAFAPETLHDIFGEILAREGLNQLRIAETEKYAHVTFFFNGGREEPLPGESRELIPSPDVATYDLQPEMSAPELTEALSGAITGGEYDVVICNVANPDMVGHTGVFAAAVEAVEAVDECLGKVAAAIEAVGGELLITADHGNIEDMLDEQSQQPQTAHTTNPVPLVFIGRPAAFSGAGSLRDIAPTMLKLLGIDAPAAMTGRSLLEFASEAAA